MAESSEEPAAPVAPGTEQPSGRATPADQIIAVGERAWGAVTATLREIGSRRGMPLTVAGVVVLILAWLSERDSAWGFPMLITGLALVGIGLVGPRLSGSMALRWGEDGAHFHLTSTVAPPGQRGRAPAIPTLSEAERESAGAATGEPGDERARLLPPSEIDGSAETIEFSVEAMREASADGSERSG